jgi:hypothetical protein
MTFTSRGETFVIQKDHLCCCRNCVRMPGTRLSAAWISLQSRGQNVTEDMARIS